MRAYQIVAAALTLATSVAQAAVCTTATINPNMAQRIPPRLTQDAISAMLGCSPVELPPEPGVVAASRILAWGLIDGALKKQIAVQFDSAGASASARYQEIPLLFPGKRASDSANDDTKKALALALMLAASGAARSAAGGAPSVCTPATINPAAVMGIRPHMTPAAVSAVLGCSPTEIGPVWIWGIPLASEVASKIQIAVVFDEEGVSSAHYQLVPPLIRPAGNGALRVEPPPPTFGNWVPGTAQILGN